VAQDGNEIMQGTDVAERDDDGRLRRILMFQTQKQREGGDSARFTAW
jgi:hypothetical protein